MQMLYDSEAYVVVHLQAEAQESSVAQDAAWVTQNRVVSAEAISAEGGPRLARHGFEIVDKRAGKEVFLDGSWAELFQQQINAWQQNTPTQDEVEDTLERYAQLAQNPVVLH